MQCSLISTKKLTLKVVPSSRHPVSESCCSCLECFIQRIIFSFTYRSQMSSPHGRRLKPHSVGLGQHIELASKYSDCMKENSWYPPYVVDKGCLFQSGPAHITSFPHLFSCHQTLVMFSCRAPMPLLWKKTLVQSSFRSMNTTSDWSM